MIVRDVLPCFVVRSKVMERSLVALLITMVSLTGCSAIAVRGAARRRAGEVVCGSTYAAPVIDTAIAAAGVGLIVWSATDPDSNNPETDGHALTGREFAAAPGALVAIAFGLAALYGYSKVGTCKAAARGPTMTADLAR